MEFFYCFIAKQLDVDINYLNIDDIKDVLIKSFMQFWKELFYKMLQFKTLRTYFNLKDMFKRETYLNTVMNIETKMHLKQMRISAHKLAIEQGRY